MLITRWQAPLVPSKEQLKIMMEQEGLEPLQENYRGGEKVVEHRHPFTEIRVILEGEMLFNVSGNQFLVRAGDRLEIPANTKHWFQAHGTADCVCICAQRVF